MITRTVILFTLLVFNVTFGEVSRLSLLRYYVTIEPHFEDDNEGEPISFEGKVQIDFKSWKDTNNLTFHQVNLQINKSSIELFHSYFNYYPNITKITDNELDQTCTIQLDKNIEAGYRYIFIGSFRGKLENTAGFFRPFYASDEKSSNLSATHFQINGARRMFPCFDEPDLKARFKVILIRTAGYTSISNQNLEKTVDLENGRFEDHFKETPPISPFALRFAVTKYKSSEKLDQHRIIARPEAIDKNQHLYSLEMANRTLVALKEYTGIDYGLNKIDQVALPDQYFHEYTAANWGFILYSESQLLRNWRSPAKDYQKTASWIAHEFAHQWFGNLVTPTSWNYAWLSESFATYFQYHIADTIEPSWRLKEQFLLDMVQASFVLESNEGAHPLNYNPKLSNELSPNHIIKEKGSSIIRMIEHFLRPDVFRRGLQIYLEKNKFNNTEPSDLYIALQEAVDKIGTTYLLKNLKVEEIMKSWETNKGFPIVTVVRDYKTGALTIEQEASFKEDEDTTVTKWTIPINYIFSASGNIDLSRTSADYWLTEEKAIIDHDFPTEGWLIINKQATGYYRVNYDLENWERIITLLNSEDFESIPVLNRAQLIDDAFHLASIGKLPTTIAFQLGEYIIREKDFIALSPFYSALTRYIRFDNGNPGTGIVYPEFKDYVRKTLAGINASLGFKEKPGDTYLDQIHRAKFMNMFEFYHGS